MIPEILDVPGAVPIVELGVGDTRTPVGQGRWDSAIWHGSTPSGDVLVEPFNDLAAWVVVNGTPTIAAARTGDGARLPSAAAIAYNVAGAKQSDVLVVGFAYRSTSLPVSGNLILVHFGGDAGVTIHTTLQLSSTGFLRVFRSTTQIATTAAAAITANVWYYIEVRTRLDDAAGEVEVRVNGTPVIGPLTGLDTRNAGTAAVYDYVRLTGPAGTSLVDDLYISTTAAATFKGDITIPPAVLNPGGEVGTDQWAGLEPTWFDISCFVIDIEITVGRDRSMERWSVGTATVTVDNETGWADMGQGPPPAPLELTVRPGRQLRIGMSIDGGPVTWLWRGFVDDAEPSYQWDRSDVVKLACIDAKGEAGKVDLGQLAAAVGAGETATARIGRLLDLAVWPTELRTIAPTSVTLIGTTLGARVSDLLDIAADSAGGVVLGDSRGQVVFKPRDWQTYAPTTADDGTIGNVAGDVCPVGWERAFRRSDIATRTVVARSGQAARPAFNDEPNQVLYGVETIERTDLEAAQDSQLDLLGQRWLKVASANYMPRVAAVTIDAATGLAQRDLCATVDPTRPSRYRCRHIRDDGRTVFDAEFLATGVRHTISRDGWVCRITLDDAAPYIAVGGRWDQGYWDQALWANLAALLSDARQLLERLEVA